MNYTQHEDLSELFQRNLNIDQNPATPDQQFSFQQPVNETPVWSSVHYTQTAHIRPIASSEPPTMADPNRHDFLEATLHQNGIDPASLLPTQVELYQNADYDQRLRLLELWRIAPPEYGYSEEADQMHGRWPATNFQLEEKMAKLRYERQVREREQSLGRTDSVHNNQRQQQQQASRQINSETETEPYMAAGYAQLDKHDYSAEQHHTDPVYAATSMWQATGYCPPAMEDQYGAFQEARAFERLQEVNREVESRSMGNMRSMSDDDMVM